MLDDCVAARDENGLVLEWVVFEGPGNTSYQYIWQDINTYDMFPHRCNTGQCVQNVNECYQLGLVQPLCNGNGYCRADGSCEPYPGYMTFVITAPYSDAIGYPYDIKNPTAWE
jgi:hypothetical protein